MSYQGYGNSYGYTRSYTNTTDPLDKLDEKQRDELKARVAAGELTRKEAEDVATALVRASAWDFDDFDGRKESGYVGLRNQGATCYMNSLLQTFFHLRYLRRAVYRMYTQDAALPETDEWKNDVRELSKKIQEETKPDKGGQADDEAFIASVIKFVKELDMEAREHVDAAFEDAFGWDPVKCEFSNAPKKREDFVLVLNAFANGEWKPGSVFDPRKMFDKKEDEAPKPAENTKDKKSTQTSKRAKALQHLFFQLQKGHKAATTSRLTESFGWSDENAEASVQQDLAELASLLREMLEAKMKGTPSEGTTMKLFRGARQSVMASKDEQNSSKQRETFEDLQLEVPAHEADQWSLYDAFEKYTVREEMVEPNQWKVELPDGRAVYKDAWRYTEFVEFPPVLMIQLNRFAMNWEVEPPRTEKKNTILQFDERIDLSRFENRDLSRAIHDPAIEDFFREIDARLFQLAGPDKEVHLDAIRDRVRRLPNSYRAMVDRAWRELDWDSSMNDFRHPEGGKAPRICENREAAVKKLKFWAERFPRASGNAAEGAQGEKEDESLQRVHTLVPVEGEEDRAIYELFSIIAHSGTANSGHYYAYIRPGMGLMDKRMDEFIAKVQPLVPATLVTGSLADRQTAYSAIQQEYAQAQEDVQSVIATNWKEFGWDATAPYTDACSLISDFDFAIVKLKASNTPKTSEQGVNLVAVFLDQCGKILDDLVATTAEKIAKLTELITTLPDSSGLPFKSFINAALHAGSGVFGWTGTAFTSDAIVTSTATRILVKNRLESLRDVREAFNQWYEFNDSLVRPVGRDVIREMWGQRKVGARGMILSSVQAYILFYVRKSLLDKVFINVGVEDIPSEILTEWGNIAQKQKDKEDAEREKNNQVTLNVMTPSTIEKHMTKTVWDIASFDVKEYCLDKEANQDAVTLNVMRTTTFGEVHDAITKAFNLTVPFRLWRWKRWSVFNGTRFCARPVAPIRASPDRTLYDYFSLFENKKEKWNLDLYIEFPQRAVYPLWNPISCKIGFTWSTINGGSQQGYHTADQVLFPRQTGGPTHRRFESPENMLQAVRVIFPVNHQMTRVHCHPALDEERNMSDLSVKVWTIDPLSDPKRLKETQVFDSKMSPSQNTAYRLEFMDCRLSATTAGAVTGTAIENPVDGKCIQISRKVDPVPPPPSYGGTSGSAAASEPAAPKAYPLICSEVSVVCADASSELPVRQIVFELFRNPGAFLADPSLLTRNINHVRTALPVGSKESEIFHYVLHEINPAFSAGQEFAFPNENPSEQVAAFCQAAHANVPSADSAFQAFTSQDIVLFLKRFDPFTGAFTFAGSLIVGQHDHAAQLWPTLAAMTGHAPETEFVMMIEDRLSIDQSCLVVGHDTWSKALQSYNKMQPRQEFDVFNSGAVIAFHPVVAEADKPRAQFAHILDFFRNEIAKRKVQLFATSKPDDTPAECDLFTHSTYEDIQNTLATALGNPALGPMIRIRGAEATKPFGPKRHPFRKDNESLKTLEAMIKMLPVGQKPRLYYEILDEPVSVFEETKMEMHLSYSDEMGRISFEKTFVLQKGTTVAQLGVLARQAALEKTSLEQLPRDGPVMLVRIVDHQIAAKEAEGWWDEAETVPQPRMDGSTYEIRPVPTQITETTEDGLIVTPEQWLHPVYYMDKDINAWSKTHDNVVYHSQPFVMWINNNINWADFFLYIVQYAGINVDDVVATQAPDYPPIKAVEFYGEGSRGNKYWFHYPEPNNRKFTVLGGLAEYKDKQRPPQLLPVGIHVMSEEKKRKLQEKLEKEKKKKGKLNISAQDDADADVDKDTTKPTVVTFKGYDEKLKVGGEDSESD